MALLHTTNKIYKAFLHARHTHKNRNNQLIHMDGTKEREREVNKLYSPRSDSHYLSE